VVVEDPKGSEPLQETKASSASSTMKLETVGKKAENRKENKYQMSQQMMYQNDDSVLQAP